MDINSLTREAAELLREMVAIPSLSFSEDAVCDHICRWLTDRGIGHRRIGNNIVAEHITDPEAPVLILCAHIDTVAPGEDYSFDPYTPDYDKATEIIGSMLQKDDLSRDDIVAGIGSNDDGGSAVAMIAAYRWIVERSFTSSGMKGECLRTPEPPPGMDEDTFCMASNIVLALTCEEERSGKGGMTYLWPEVLSRMTRTKKYAIIGEPTGMKAATSERGLLVIDGEAVGRSGHAARNEGENALYIALEDIGKLRNHRFSKTSPRMGTVNLNVTQINAGTAHNVIPDRCTFVIDIRPTEQYSNEEILAELQSLCRSKLTARNLANRSSATAEGSPLLKAAETLGAVTFSSPTTSDWMRVGCDAIKMGPGDSARSHRKDEFILVSEIHNSIKDYIKIWQHFGAKEQKRQTL